MKAGRGKMVIFGVTRGGVGGVFGLRGKVPSSVVCSVVSSGCKGV